MSREAPTTQNPEHTGGDRVRDWKARLGFQQGWRRRREGSNCFLLSPRPDSVFERLGCAAMASLKGSTPAKTTGASTSKWSSQSSVNVKASEEAGALSARMGGDGVRLFVNPSPTMLKVTRWATVGKVFLPRPLNHHALERAMQRATHPPTHTKRKRGPK